MIQQGDGLGSLSEWAHEKWPNLIDDAKAWIAQRRCKQGHRVGNERRCLVCQRTYDRNRRRGR